ncbi:MAG: hypothetical protein M1817_003632 [Caeruleum heppii]|nr:MAG: hypothetical protein M1817_003632 [Caeruleum heppii]
MSDLAAVLSRLGLSQYLAAFLAEGFETWETLLDITEADLDSLDVKRGHRRKLQREIASSRGYSNEQALAPLRATPTDDSTTDVDGRAPLIREDTGGTITGSNNGGKRKYRRHPKPDEDAPERPPSAYVIFSNKTREDLKGQSLSFTEIAKLVGENWQVLSPVEKEPYESHAAALKERYNTEMAEYKKTDKYAEYLQYLADFKAKHANPKPAADKKRPRVENQPSTGSAESDSGQPTPSSSGPVSAGRRRVESVGSAGAPSISSGQPSPCGPHAVQLPPMAAGFGEGLSPGRSNTYGSAGRQHSPTPPSPALAGGERHHLVQGALSGTGRLPSYSNDFRDSDGAGPVPKFPRIAPIDEQSWPSSGPASLPLLGTELMARTDTMPGRSNSRRSTRSPSTLRHEDTSWSSTSSGSKGSGTTNSSAPSFGGRSGGDGGAFPRALPPPHTLAGKTGAGSSSLSTGTAPLLPPLAGLPSLPAVPYRGPQPPRAGFGPPHSISSPEEGRLINSLHTVSMHDRSHATSSGERERARQQPADSPPGHDPTTMTGEAARGGRSPSTPMSEARATSPISALLRAGERIAAREAERPP